MRSQKSNITNGEPYTWRQVSTVRGRAFGNRPPQGGYGAESLSLPFYQIHRDAIRQHPELSRKGIYVSTGGSPTRGQIKGMLEATPQANHYLCFDNDKAGQGFVELFRQIADELHIEPERVRVMPMPVWAKDWNDVLLDKASEEHIKSIEGEIEPLEMPKERQSSGMRR